MNEMWADKGPVSQGKVLTAILQGRDNEAAQMLRGWSLDDLRTLARAADRLGILATEAGNRRVCEGFAAPESGE